MLAYKFRGSSDQDLKRAQDILVNERLFCADWRRLNDPMEGHFRYLKSAKKGLPVTDTRLSEIITAKGLRKVCSLSGPTALNSRLMWAHYAAGFQGLAIGVEFDDAGNDLRPIRYDNDAPFIDLNHGDVEDHADTILTAKFSDWAYEEEFRILSGTERFSVAGRVREVIVGFRIDPDSLSILRHTCVGKGVPLKQAKLGRAGVVIEPLVPAAGVAAPAV